MTSDAFIYGGGRSAFGRHGGVLAGLRADDLLAGVIRAAVSESGFAAEAYEDVIVGCSNQAGEDCRNVARFAALRAGLAVEVGGITVNRLCGSGLAAVLDAARAVKTGEGDLLLAGGVESMSRAPLVLSKAAAAYDRGQQLADSTLGARFSNPAFIADYGSDSMPQTADNVARELAISRGDSDSFAAASQAKYEKARGTGFFKDEIIPVTVPPAHKRSKPAQTPAPIVEDEHPRPGTTADKLATLAPLFEGGVVTAGNASGINDGACAITVGNRSIGEKHGAAPRARIVAGAVAGVEPRVMGLGPVFAIRKALMRAGLELKDMGLIEINEAFAPQVLGCLKLLQVDFADSRVNPNGGAIAVGHPLGASGARIALTATRHMAKAKLRYGVISLCIGIGQGIAAVLELTE